MDDEVPGVLMRAAQAPSVSLTAFSMESRTSLRDLVPLSDPLLCQADVAGSVLASFGISFPRDSFLNDVVDPLLRHCLREEPHVADKGHDLHLSCHYACGGHPAEAVGLPV